MLNQFAKSCCVIAGIAITTLSTTGYAGIFGAMEQSADALQMARTLSALNASSAASSQDGPFIPGAELSGNAIAYGKTYGEWSAEWWKWALSFPDGMNPVQDETGKFCDLGQSGRVWFLAGTFGGSVERSCTIPAGKAIFYPIINTTWVDEPGDEIFTDEEVRWVLANLTGAGDNACQMSSTLDTYSTPNLGELPAPISARLRPAVRSQSPKFSFNFSADNVIGLPVGVNDRLIAEGYWVMLPPLTSGEHVLTLHGAACIETEDGIEKAFETEVTYYLTVVPGNRP